MLYLQVPVFIRDLYYFMITKTNNRHNKQRLTKTSQLVSSRTLTESAGGGTTALAVALLPCNSWLRVVIIIVVGPAILCSVMKGVGMVLLGMDK